jgi:hypothetical protein
MRPLALLAVAAAALLVVTASAAAKQGLCVGQEPGCFSTVQAAVDAARDGDTIQVHSGTWAGGVTVTRSVDLVGAGHAVVTGGGPVLTIGSATSTPTVTISNLTVTGGVTTTDPQAPGCGPDVPTCGPGYASATALGGGIEAFPGTTVTLSHAVVTGNVASPATSVTSVKAVCPGDVPCRASFGDAAGIDNWGTMLLDHSIVSDNHASAVQSNGGGIVDESGASLTIRHSIVSGNTAAAAAPDGRFASGGGVFVDSDATLVVEHSSVGGNGASVTSSLPRPYPKQGGNTDQSNALGGGILVADGGTATISNSHLDDNTIEIDDPLGEPFGADAALCAFGDATIDHGTLDGNSVTVNVLSTADSGPSGPGALEADAGMSIDHTRITNNSIAVTSSSGDAAALGAVGFFVDGPTVTVADSVIGGNTATATSPNGAASVQGAGLLNNAPLLLADDQITANVGTANGLTALAQGGGIWNGDLFVGHASPPPVTLQNTSVTGNTLTGSPGAALDGGGLYTVGFPVTLLGSPIEGNAPDQCAGC